MGGGAAVPSSGVGVRRRLPGGDHAAHSRHGQDQPALPIPAQDRICQAATFGHGEYRSFQGRKGRSLWSAVV